MCISDAKRIKNCHCQFVSNFLSYFSAKYYLNWFTFRKYIVKVKTVTFLETVCYVKSHVMMLCIPTTWRPNVMTMDMTSSHHMFNSNKSYLISVISGTHNYC